MKRQVLLSEGVSAVGEKGVSAPESLAGDSLCPRWDAEARQLWLGNEVIKAFRQPAERQTIILKVFQEQGWAAHIDDPLPPQAGEGKDEAKRRLHSTIQNLNRGLPRGTIRFRGDGTGEGAVWEYDVRKCRRK